MHTPWFDFFSGSVLFWILSKQFITRFRIAAHHIRVACRLIQAFLFLWSASSKERQRITPAKIRYLLAPSYFAQIAHIMISREFHTPRFDLRFCLFDFRRDIHSTDLNWSILNIRFWVHYTVYWRWFLLCNHHSHSRLDCMPFLSAKRFKSYMRKRNYKSRKRAAFILTRFFKEKIKKVRLNQSADCAILVLTLLCFSGSGSQNPFWSVRIWAISFIRAHGARRRLWV